jgi:hypothetical protein
LSLGEKDQRSLNIIRFFGFKSESRFNLKDSISWEKMAPGWFIYETSHQILILYYDIGLLNQSPLLDWQLLAHTVKETKGGHLPLIQADINPMLETKVLVEASSREHRKTPAKLHPSYHNPRNCVTPSLGGRCQGVKCETYYSGFETTEFKPITLTPKNITDLLSIDFLNSDLLDINQINFNGNQAVINFKSISHLKSGHLNIKSQEQAKVKVQYGYERHSCEEDQWNLVNKDIIQKDAYIEHKFEIKIWQKMIKSK